MEDDSTWVRELSDKILKNAAINYGLDAQYGNPDLKKKCIDNMYGFLKWVYSGTTAVYTHYLLRLISGDGDNYFLTAFKQEAAWLLIGCNLPESKDTKITIPNFLKQLISSKFGIAIPDGFVTQWPHPSDDKFISDDVIDNAVKEFKAKNG